MKTIYTLIIILLLSNSITAQVGQDQCDCCSEQYQQFDFWLGEWEVFNPEGKKVGENKILKLHDNCVIQENWTSVGQHTGTSYNFYNKNDNSWNQIWIDNSGKVLKLKGIFENNKMVLKSEKIKSQDTDSYFTNRIIWTKDTTGNVNQKWEIIDDDEKVLKVVFDGIYKRKSSSDGSKLEKSH